MSTTPWARPRATARRWLPEADSGFEAGGGNPPDSLGGKARPPAYNNHDHHATSYPLTPPNSFGAGVHIPRPVTTTTAATSGPTLPPSPATSLASTHAAQSLISSRPCGPPSNSNSSTTAPNRCAPVFPLINSVFPYAASDVAASSYMLEIVTPPDLVLKGFVSDHDSLGRIAFVHLPPTLSGGTSPAPPERLAPHFSDVLRPHDPRRAHPRSPSPPPPQGLDIRESLTALLDLADALEAAQLVLVLDKDEREPAPLAELMHALMFVGGAAVCPGVPVGDWEWDSRRWALVSIEL